MDDKWPYIMLRVQGWKQYTVAPDMQVGKAWT